jgi:hypothetical protein
MYLTYPGTGFQPNFTNFLPLPPVPKFTPPALLSPAPNFEPPSDPHGLLSVLKLTMIFSMVEGKVVELSAVQELLSYLGKGSYFVGFNDG